MKKWISFTLIGLLFMASSPFSGSTPEEMAGIGFTCPPARYVILMIGDGMGYNQVLAAQQVQGGSPVYQNWRHESVSTYPAGGDYDPAHAWTDFGYALQNPTDSAAAATALSTGQKTDNLRIGTSPTGQRLTSLVDLARAKGKATGAVTTVFISHATPGGWLAHNDSRSNGFAIADESLWGDPDTTGTPTTNTAYSGGYGPSLPPADVLIGAGHPAWYGGTYVNQTIRDRLATDAAHSPGFAFVERLSGHPDGGLRLLQAAADPAIHRLVGLFGGPGGNLEFRQADGSGANPENPTLAEMAQAALHVLSRDPEGFVLLVEGGAIDWAAHANQMDTMIGEVIGFNQAVQAVSDWIDDPASPATWDNTLVIVTADHESGYLTQAPGKFSNLPLGTISPATLALEKTVSGTAQRASWNDLDKDSKIDSKETVYWAWNSSGHSNSLVSLYAKGAGAEAFAGAADQTDPVRGPYLDNTEVFQAMQSAGFSAACKLNYLPVINR